MRKSRFSGLADSDGAAERRPSPLSLLTFDLRAAADESAETIAAERARTIAAAAPLLAGSHLLWALVLAWSLGGSVVPALPLLLLSLAWLVAADVAGWTVSRRLRRPASLIRLAAAQLLLTGGAWIGVAVLAARSPGGTPPAVVAALLCGAGSSLAIFFPVPVLAAASCVLTWATAAAVGVDRELLGIGGALGLILFLVSLFRARDQISAAGRRLSAEAEAEKAGRFVQEYEASGRGWFWETNAEGTVTYASDQLAARLGLTRDAVIGRRFEDVLFAREAGSPLGFHLSARFPFSEVIVRAPEPAEETWWALSGSPSFDRYGRFLGFRGLGVNLSEQQRGEAETKRLARFDSLTGLPNRATMRSMLDEALANAEARRRGCALFMIDLDRFKQVNDTLGHPVGDKLLRKVADRLRAVIGEHGQVGRLGGDEFEAILPGLDAEGALAELARALVAEVSRPYMVDDHRIEIGASVGIAIASPGRCLADTLVRDADLALYAAKAQGRGTHRFFAPEMHREAADRQRLEADVKEALARGELRLLFQPIVESVSEEVVAFEALLRWQHPTRGLVPPADLIPVAEECGAMPLIGDWILRTACAEAAKWPAHIRVAVNLSPAQFADPALAATLTATLAQSGLDPDRLELEVSEAVFLADPGATDERLQRLKRIGVRLALDNFGTGQAGLGHLRSAPLDKIKIDRSFVQGAAASGSRNAAIVRGIVVLAESLGMDTTAEGVEALEDVTLVRRLGCNQVQGWLFGKPMPADEALRLATESRPSAEVIGFSRPPRHRLIRNGRLDWAGGAMPVRLRNISEGGAMLDCDAALPVGLKVALDLDDAGRIPADVRWCNRGQIGLMFAESFNLARLARTGRIAQASSPKTLRPDYLDRPAAPADPEPASRSPLATKRKRA